jgi:hypothetical protein
LDGAWYCQVLGKRVIAAEGDGVLGSRDADSEAWDVFVLPRDGDETEFEDSTRKLEWLGAV